jgi:hypothetical protein
MFTFSDTSTLLEAKTNVPIVLWSLILEYIHPEIPSELKLIETLASTDKNIALDIRKYPKIWRKLEEKKQLEIIKKWDIADQACQEFSSIPFSYNILIQLAHYEAIALKLLLMQYIELAPFIKKIPSDKKAELISIITQHESCLMHLPLVSRFSDDAFTFLQQYNFLTISLAKVFLSTAIHFLENHKMNLSAKEIFELCKKNPNALIHLIRNPNKHSTMDLYLDNLLKENHGKYLKDIALLHKPVAKVILSNSKILKQLPEVYKYIIARFYVSDPFFPYSQIKKFNLFCDHMNHSLSNLRHSCCTLFNNLFRSMSVMIL